ncbi:prephenate dehydrogenase/arogenate dehydrogenase family protein [Candidatus Fermentibacteria bacterium]|nr:prephenate dehydrogenase/arogenate dehydrogenase family protein [Candidatus Fermentibacteria bacterium]
MIMNRSKVGRNGTRAPRSVCVVGGAGGMGRMFTRLLRGRLEQVMVADVSEGPVRWREAVACEMVLLAVPIGEMARVVRRMAPLTGNDCAVIDLCSTKSGPLGWMRESLECQVLGTHPFFGPSTASLEGRLVFTCQGRPGDLTRWFEWMLREEGAELVDMDPLSHDRLMARVQVLRQAVLLLTARSLEMLGCDPRKLSGLAGETTFSLWSLMLRQMEENSVLWADIWLSNPFTPQVLESLNRALAETRGWFDSGDRDELSRKLNRSGSGTRRTFAPRPPPGRSPSSIR